MSVLNHPKIEAFIGAPGSGKGVSVNELLKRERPKRMLIWDPRNEYAAHAPQAASLVDMAQKCKAAGKSGGLRMRYVPSATMDLPTAFGVVCKLAFEWGDCMFLAEELSDVTTASHSPAPWRRVITQGRHQGLYIVGVAQRPALIDKNFLGACTYIRCFTLRYRNDRQAMAQALDVPEAMLTELQTMETATGVQINYVERQFRGGEVAKKGTKTLRRRG